MLDEMWMLGQPPPLWLLSSLPSTGADGQFERARPTWQAAPLGPSMQAGDNCAGSGLLRGRKSLASRDVMLLHPK